MTESDRLLEEIYHALGNHVAVDLDNGDVLSAQYTVNHCINKMELYFKRTNKL
jgi:hypothetical protein